MPTMSTTDLRTILDTIATMSRNEVEAVSDAVIARRRLIIEEATVRTPLPDHIEVGAHYIVRQCPSRPDLDVVGCEVRVINTFGWITFGVVDVRLLWGAERIVLPMNPDHLERVEA